MQSRLVSYAIRSVPMAFILALSLANMIFGVLEPGTIFLGDSIYFIIFVFVPVWAALFGWLIYEDPYRPRKKCQKGFDILPPK